MFSDGTIDTTAMYADSQTVACETAGELALTVPTSGTITAGTVFAYPADAFGDESALIEGTFAEGKFTATTASEIAVGTKYTVGYVINRTGVKNQLDFNQIQNMGYAEPTIIENGFRLVGKYYAGIKNIHVYRPW